MSGDGTWRLTARTLQYTVGDASGASVVQLEKGELTLTPDPVLTAPPHGARVLATYRRSR